MVRNSTRSLKDHTPKCIPSEFGHPVLRHTFPGPYISPTSDICLYVCIHIYVYIYIYIERERDRERERERERDVCVCTYIYIYIYVYRERDVCIYIYIYISRPRGDRKFGGCFVWVAWAASSVWVCCGRATERASSTRLETSLRDETRRD